MEKILKLGAKGGIEGEGGKITVLQGKISSGVMNICIIYKTPVNLSIFLQALQFVLLPLHMKGQKIIVILTISKPVVEHIDSINLTAKVKESTTNYSTCLDHIYTKIELECGVAETFLPQNILAAL